MKAYTPTQASANTSSPVKTNFSNLAGSAPLSIPKTGAQIQGNPHARQGVPSFSSTPKALGGFVQHETRQGPVPHISMKPGKI